MTERLRRIVDFRRSKEQPQMFQYPIEHSPNEPKSDCAVVFPGQDIGRPGMLDDLRNHPAGKEVIDRADELLKKEKFGFTVSEITDKDIDPSILRNTKYNQVAVYVWSMALHNIHKYDNNKKRREGFATLPRFETGNSMGIVAAMVAAGVINFEDGLRLIAKRGEIMQEFGDKRLTAMRLILKTKEAEMLELMKDHPDIKICLFLSEDMIVYGGTLDALKNFDEELEQKKKTIRKVNTDRAMHSSYITPAKPEFVKYIDKIKKKFKKPLTPIIGTQTGEPITDVEGIIEELLYGFDNTFDNRKIHSKLDKEGVQAIYELHDKGLISRSMEKMFDAVEEHKVPAIIAGGVAISTALALAYRIITRHHPQYPPDLKK